MTVASVSRTWELHIFRHVCACSHAQLQHPPHPSYYRPHSLKHIAEYSLFAHMHEKKNTHTHTHQRTHTHFRCRWNIYRSHASTHKHGHSTTKEHTRIHADTYTQTRHMQQTHTLTHTAETSSPLPPNWIVCSDNPQDSRSIDVRGRPMKIQGPWGGLRELCTSSQLGSQALQPPMSVLLFLFTLIHWKMQ